MPAELVKYAFIGGEISPSLLGRTDLTKYDLAVAEGYNFFVDYRGGLSTRPGTQFGDFLKRDDLDIRFVSFAFAPDLSNNYLLIFGHNYVRFVQDNAYVLDTDLTITAVTQATPPVVTSAAHGLTTGMWVKISGVAGMTQLNGKTYSVTVLTANTFSLQSVPDGASVPGAGYSAYTSGGLASPIYEVATDYASTDLAGLSFSQYRDLIRITSESFPITNLIRNDNTDWEFALEDISPYYAGPAVTSSTASDTGDAQTVFAVTKVLADGTESTHGGKYLLSNIVNYPATEGSISINWAAQSDAIYYNVYRSIVSVTESLTRGVEMGYVGKTTGTKFTDPNIIPDFTKAIPINYNPFEPGAIERITVTNGGAGYSVFSTTVGITDPDGTGFVGEAIISAAGVVVNVIVLSGGSGYTNPTVTFSGGGASAAATATVRELEGTYPTVSAVFQQRQDYAASFNLPTTIWGSRIKSFSNFNTSDLVLDVDSFEFDIDTPAVAAIRHLLVTRGGLLAMTQENVWLLNGGSSGEAITPTNALAEPQTYNGVSVLRPLQVDNDIIFTEGKGFAVKVLAYNEISKVYGGDDRSIFASHLFGIGKTISRWCYQESPFKVVWSVRSDGALLAFTYVKSEEVFAWTPCGTRGKFLDVIAIRENENDRIYLQTQRFIDGRWTKFFERMDLRQFVNVEDAWCVDAGLSLGSTSPGGTATIHHDLDTDVWTVETSASVMGSTEGFKLRVGNGVFEVAGVTGATGAELTMIEPPTNWIPETEKTMTFPTTDWTLDEGVTELSGLYHLEGETVAILADGNVFPNQVVTDGTITLDQPVTRAVVGLPFHCQGRTLPAVVPDSGIEARRKRVNAIAVRMDKSRGLKVGYGLDNLYSFRERTNENYGYPTRLVNGVKYQPISTNWEPDAQTYFRVDDPLPVTLLNLVLELDVGDEPN